MPESVGATLTVLPTLRTVPSGDTADPRLDTLRAGTDRLPTPLQVNIRLLRVSLPGYGGREVRGQLRLSGLGAALQQVRLLQRDGRVRDGGAGMTASWV